VVGEVEPPQEADPLLFLREVQEDLHDLDAVVGEVALPVVDLLVAALPHILSFRLLREQLALQQLGVHPHHQYFLILRPG
jgi:hypothetical protein